MTRSSQIIESLPNPERFKRAFARLKTQRTFHKARTNPNRPTSTTKTILTLERQH